jgi:CBS-domain-containing membrane protein
VSDPYSPFGALITLLYGLTAAPAAQPRNVVLGQALSMCIAMIFADMDHIAGWIRQALAAAIAIAAMVKLGITHPPAGASALLFSTGEYGWGNMMFMLVGNIMAVLTATIINNMSYKRQYPTFWGFPDIGLFRFVRNNCGFPFQKKTWEV